MTTNELLDNISINSQRILLLTQQNSFLKETLRRCGRCAEGDRYSLVQEEVSRQILMGEIRPKELDCGTPYKIRVNSISIIVKDALDG